LNFLNSAILLGLAAVLLPLLIHLFTRSKARPVVFSSLRFLRALQNQKIRRVRLRQILLLILRTLIVALLVLGFARPTCRTTASPQRADAKTSTVIILDHSASMSCQYQGVTSLQTARSAASQFVAAMQPGDELFVVSSNDTTADLWRRAYHDYAIVQKQIDALEPVFTGTDLSGALKFSQNLLMGAHNINKEIVLFSDLQKSGFKVDSLALRDEQLRLFAVPVRPPATANLTITSVELKSSILQPGRPVELQVGVSNWSDAPAQNKIVQIFADGRRMAQRVVSLESGTSAVETFHLLIDRGGWVKGYALLEEDDLSEDNRRYFSFYIPEHIQLAIVGEESRGKAFLSLVMSPDPESGDYFKIKSMVPERLLTQPLDSLNVIVLYDLHQLASAVVAKLRDFQEKGGGLVVILGEQTDVRWYNQSFAPALGLPLVGAITEESGPVSIGRSDLEHPIFSGIFTESEGRFASPRFSFALKLLPALNAHTIMSLSNGDPFLVENRNRQGANLLFASSFEPDVSDIAYKTIFAPLIYRSLSYVGIQSQNRDDAFRTGDLLRYRLPGQLLSRKLEMERPGEEVDAVKPVLTAAGAWIEYQATTLPGVYTLFADGREIAVWAVNIPADEFDLEAVKQADLEKRYHMQMVTPPGALADAVKERRMGRELWRYFILAALLLLLTEMLIYREKGEVAPRE